ncbi:hypothetical protein DCCM_2913 [Desulfocucumis palustris]|uniref:Lipoprotein n=1 Tax=Desulfocucumis palustris TaxID=1898651 RepID=A0A2L2XCG4_9FIRM|nr:hypothetical protein [Desulfocucumis palustris]GBF33802.1 hypothetical protein DCCM_2913 [Desulfocucumis palustris]
MGLKLRLLAAMLLIVFIAGCGDKAPPEVKPPETGKESVEVDTGGSDTGGSKQSVVSPGKDDGAVKKIDGGKDKAAGSAVKPGGQPGGAVEKPDLVIKSENQVPGQEAGQMLEEIDRQLDDLLEALDGTEDIDESELLYEGEQ